MVFARPRLLLCLALLALASGVSAAWAQPPLTPEPRRFAPGVLQVIPVDIMPDETTSVHDVVELRANGDLDWRPELIAPSKTLYAKSREVRFRRDVWQLEFAFKPLRMIWIDLPNAAGVPERRLVWYLVYRVTNRGEVLSPTEEAGGVFETAKAAGGPLKFVPQFVLEGHETDSNGDKLYRAYLDKYLPLAIEPIRRREVPGRALLSGIEMSRREIPVAAADDGQAVWGVATWTDIDPEMDFFSIFVRGLTNAYRWQDPPGGYALGDPPGAGRQFVRKTLQLCFWRPGDQFLEHESEVRFGSAPGRESLYGVGEGVAHRWIYR